jgi:predicted dienelactone hydrolase
MQRLAGLLCALMLGCAPTENTTDAGPALLPLPFQPAGPNAAPNPAELGPYAVGVRTMTFTDARRMTPGRTTPRQLICEVWYPAAESARGVTETYVLHDSLPDSLKQTIPVSALGEVVTPAQRDAAPTLVGGPFPLVLFSHGKGGIRMQSTFYTTYLASHGYVVVSPDHEGDTLPELLEAMVIDPVGTLDAYVFRQEDMLFLLDTWAALPADHPLHGITDMERVGITGHSFGALTAMKVAALDPRLDAVVAQTPATYLLVQADVPTPLNQLQLPIMLQAADLDQTLPPDPHTLSNWENMGKPRYMLRIKTAGHFTYSDLCVLDLEQIDMVLSQDISNVLRDGCGTANTAPAVAQPLIRHYAIALFNQYLRNSQGSASFLTQQQGEQFSATEVDFTADP